ncbi:MAG: hypothetical protein H0W11_07545 [Gemmatimonadetes bacterium]|jgi:hypothetical protein|nr:hypothetical protein [Gemmatimonadota bacterium]
MPEDARYEALEHEDEILAACALRFHGYRYAEDTGFDMAAARDECERTNRYDHLSLPEQMAVLFFIQRTVRWVEQDAPLPRDGSLFRAYRELFLHVADQEVPAEYRIGRDDSDFSWGSRFEPMTAEHIALVRRIHESTRYSDDRRGTAHR